MEHREKTSEMALILDRARLEAREIQPLVQTYPELDLEAAYRVQDEGIRLRESRGEKAIGLKMGFTSEAKRQQMGLHLPIYGVLTDRMKVQDGGVFSLKGSIHPKIEPEIAFKIARDLRGKVSREEALAACEWVSAAMEILDSRFTGFKYFSLPDVVADNCSSSHFVVSGRPSSIKDIDLANLTMTMEVNDDPVQSAPSSAISGDPALSIVELCGLLDSRGLALKAGTIVMAGAATQAVPMKSGDRVRLRVTGLETVEVGVER